MTWLLVLIVIGALVFPAVLEAVRERRAERRREEAVRRWLERMDER